MNYLVSILEIKNLDNSKFPDSLPKSTIKATLKRNSKLASPSIVYIQMLTQDASALTIGENIELEDNDFQITIKETPKGDIKILSIV